MFNTDTQKKEENKKEPSENPGIRATKTPIIPPPSQTAKVHYRIKLRINFVRAIKKKILVAFDLFNVVRLEFLNLTIILYLQYIILNSFGLNGKTL